MGALHRQLFSPYRSGDLFPGNRSSVTVELATHKQRALRMTKAYSEPYIKVARRTSRLLATNRHEPIQQAEENRNDAKARIS